MQQVLTLHLQHNQVHGEELQLLRIWLTLLVLLINQEVKDHLHLVISPILTQTQNPIGPSKSLHTSFSFFFKGPSFLVSELLAQNHIQTVHNSETFYSNKNIMVNKGFLTLYRPLPLRQELLKASLRVQNRKCKALAVN